MDFFFPPFLRYDVSPLEGTLVVTSGLAFSKEKKKSFSFWKGDEVKGELCSIIIVLFLEIA